MPFARRSTGSSRAWPRSANKGTIDTYEERIVRRGKLALSCAIAGCLAAGAVSVAVGSTGSFKHLETHDLLTQDQLGEMLGSARDARRRYQPPRQPYVGP